jgi:hypothetical protein
VVHQPQPRTAWYSLIPRVAHDWLLEQYPAVPTRPYTSQRVLQYGALPTAPALLARSLSCGKSEERPTHRSLSGSPAPLTSVVTAVFRNATFDSK